VNQPWNGPQQYHPLVTPPISVQQNNAVGLIALIVGVIGFIFACIPGALVVGWVLLPIAFILGVVGLCLSGKSKGTSIGAVAVSVVGVVVGVVVFMTVVSDAFKDAFDGSDLSTPSTRSGLAGPAESQTSKADQPGSRSDPLPIGQAVTNKEWEITLGTPNEAWSEISAENQFNEPPAPGMEYWIVPVKATYTGDETGNLAFGISVKFVGSDNRTYEDRCGVLPNPLDDIGDLYSGGTASGNICVAVPTGADGLWAVATGFGDPVFFTAR
jgi:hypothetical protein